VNRRSGQERPHSFSFYAVASKRSWQTNFQRPLISWDRAVLRDGRVLGASGIGGGCSFPRISFGEGGKAEKKWLCSGHYGCKLKAQFLPTAIKISIQCLTIHVAFPLDRGAGRFAPPNVLKLWTRSPLTSFPS
jgi:hypothetical protein